jgi:hypothetical protein
MPQNGSVEGAPAFFVVGPNVHRTLLVYNVFFAQFSPKAMNPDAATVNHTRQIGF